MRTHVFPTRREAEDDLTSISQDKSVPVHGPPETSQLYKVITYEHMRNKQYTHFNMFIQDNAYKNSEIDEYRRMYIFWSPDCIDIPCRPYDMRSGDTLLTPWLMEPGGSMPHSKRLSNNLYPEANQSNSSY